MCFEKYKFSLLQSGDAGNASEGFTFVSMFPEVWYLNCCENELELKIAHQRLHIILVPFFTAFYNIGAAIGVYPTLAEAEKRLPHHLRYIYLAARENI